YRLNFYLAPPLLAAVDPVTTEPKKQSYGPWILHVFRLLARLRWLRGTPFDLFGYTKDRRVERQLIRDYEALLEELLHDLSPDRLDASVELASLPQRVRGFGPVKERHLEHARKREAELLKAFREKKPAPERSGGPVREVAVIAG